MAWQLFAYYPDLADERVKSALAIVHQRYSTNTFPNWRLAQPFRCIAHNGEINTLSGNRNAMRAREPKLASPAFGEHISDLFPILVPGGSDSACFDNTLELLVRAGRSMPHAMMMMIPEAFGAKYHISTDKRAFYEYHSSFLEPWDGPAAMLFTDGRLIGGTLDRNGLRPCRYLVTTDGLAIIGSEAGVVEFPPEKIRDQGPAAAGTHVPRRYRRGPDHLGQRDQEQDRPPEAVSPLAGREPHRAARAVRCARSSSRATRRPSPSGCGPSATRGKSSRWS